MAIGGKLSSGTAGQHHRRFAASLERHDPDLPLAFWGALRIDQGLAVARPTVGRDLRINADENLFGTATVGALAVEAKMIAALGHVGDPLAIGRPGRVRVRDGAKGQPRANPKRQIEHPDVVHTGVDLQSDAISLWRDPCHLQVRELLGYRADLFSVAIHPDQLQVATAAAAENQQSIGCC